MSPLKNPLVLLQLKLQKPRFQLRRLYHWLLPDFCVLCQTAVKGNTLCQDCYDELPWQLNACKRCGYPLSGASHCGQCLQHPPPYDTTIALFHYQPPIDQLILALKFAEMLSYGKLLGELLGEKLSVFYASQDLPEIILPVPLHPQRLQERGYNQALEISHPIAKKLRIPIESTHCQRILPTLPQSSTTAEERQRNIKNAFTVDDKFQATHVAIIDDVVTTGSTVAELAKVLRQAGVQRIDVWCCARTLLLCTGQFSKEW